ncbi:ATP-binding cassette domain-containing protein [Azotobacter chroococcum]|uniref:ATP-binding cassette domain-containing protein n=1 Tax=Azotobacter chroococcum TaxID=353 RepID=A0AAP9YCE3_9GAMM|nr:ATP-binding cassette domain-containing protein [Azotobacter chroococcum]QQE88700.1 ATP-binding cassette domain-containing protein [Azotobacter chroococcum]
MPLFTLPNFLRRPRSSHPAPPERLHFHLRKRLTSASGPLELDIELDIARGESLALLGPSGSGKTSLLRLLAGLQPADGGYIAAFGRIWLDSACGIDRPPRERRAGLVFQDYALFPNMSVLGNVRFALPSGSPARRADELLERVGLAGLANERPARLSGGQQQRLALARALAAEPELLLLDEPLSALDGTLRRDLQDALAALRERQRTTLLLVTHDPGEALRLCERAVLLEAGRVAADAPPARLFGAGCPADAEQRLTLAGRVLERIAAADGSPLYRIEAEGRTCLARAAERAGLEPGDSVLVSAGDWLATPLHGLR